MLRNAFENLSTEGKQDLILLALAGLQTALGGTLSVGGPLTDTQLRASPPAVKDDYFGGQVLAQETGADAVITFTFSSAVQLVVVEMYGDGLVARADPFGGTPAEGFGIPCRHEVPTYLPVTSSSVKVWAPATSLVNVWGYRRA